VQTSFALEISGLQIDRPRRDEIKHEDLSKWSQDRGRAHLGI
jgi:hypothetical protein